jgi:hypothetical protein
MIDPSVAVRDSENSTLWYSIDHLDIEGLGFERTGAYLCRLPERARGAVSDGKWNLAHHSAGVYVRFVTDAPRISARWRLRYESLAMNHMPATGVSGLDIYVLSDGSWKWAGVGVPQKQENKADLCVGIKPGRHQFMLYLPLYNGVESVEIGLPEGAVLEKAPDWPGGPHKPMCFYGTSIVQGGCASRPGMAYPAILSRRLQRPAINLGFSGNARSEPEFARLLAELDPSVYVLDPLPNMNPQLVRERIAPMVETLRSSRPRTPIVLVENIIPQASHIKTEDIVKGVSEKNAELRAAYERLLDAGVKNIRYVGGATLYGSDWEATVDGVHATDVGFMRLADALERVLAELV